MLFWCEKGVLRLGELAPSCHCVLGGEAGPVQWRGHRSDWHAAATQSMRVTTAGSPPLDPRAAQGWGRGEEGLSAGSDRMFRSRRAGEARWWRLQ